MVALRIEPLPEGGILVSEVMSASGIGGECFCPLLFACSNLGDALDFIKGKLAPVAADGNKLVAQAESEAFTKLADELAARHAYLKPPSCAMEPVEVKAKLTDSEARQAFVASGLRLEKSDG